MRYPWLVPLALTLACSDDIVAVTTTATTGGGSTAPDTTSGPGSTGPVDPTTAGPSTTADASTTAPDPASTGTTDATTDATTGDPGPILPGECESNADCKLFADCCECKGVPADDTSLSCPLKCEQSRCDALAVDAAICRLGQCITERLDCDASKVICLAFPPECPDGTRAGVDGDCWTGLCVPAEICNVITDCEDCPAEWMCVSDVPFGPPIRRCEPLPADCPGEPDCACAGAVCTDQFTVCSDPGGNGLDCECVDC